MRLVILRVTLFHALSVISVWPLQEFLQPLLDFRTRQGALRERRVALSQHSFVKGNAELEQCCPDLVTREIFSSNGSIAIKLSMFDD